MSAITEKIKNVLTIPIKARADSYTDQYHRLFMVKICTVSCVLLGINWLKDPMSCIIPSSSGMDSQFTSQACWIRGFFVYKELRHVPGVFGYYGIPNNLNHDGFDPRADNKLSQCRVVSGNSCVPYTKTFYLQYQWFPFFMAALAVMFYLPYIFFQAYNTDIASLKANLRGRRDNTVTIVSDIMSTYFNPSQNTVRRMSIRVFVNVILKAVYLITYVVAFRLTDDLLYGGFSNYGSNWFTWNKQPNERYDYTAATESSNPSRALLPAFGICEVIELGKDIKYSLYNKHKFICEISQNVLYEYVLLVLWLLFVIGLVISMVGLLMEIGNHLVTYYCFVFFQGEQARLVYAKLRIRECQYLEHIRKENLTIYYKVISQLKERRANHVNEDDGGHTSRNCPYTESKVLLNEMNRGY